MQSATVVRALLLSLLLAPAVAALAAEQAGPSPKQVGGDVIPMHLTRTTATRAP